MRITATTFDAALREGAGARALRGLQDVAAQNSALLEVTPGTEASLRLGRRARPAPTQGILVPFVDRPRAVGRQAIHRWAQSPLPEPEDGGARADLERPRAGRVIEVRVGEQDVLHLQVALGDGHEKGKCIALDDTLYKTRRMRRITEARW